MSTLSSMHAWEKGERRAKSDGSKSVWVYHAYDACKSGMVRVATALLLHDKGKCTASDRLPRPFRVVWGILAAGAIPKMPAHSGGAWNTTWHSTADGGAAVLYQR